MRGKILDRSVGFGQCRRNPREEPDDTSRTRQSRRPDNVGQ